MAGKSTPHEKYLTALFTEGMQSNSTMKNFSVLIRIVEDIKCGERIEEPETSHTLTRIVKCYLFHQHQSLLNIKTISYKIINSGT